QHLGHPVIGDSTYGAKQNKKLAELTGYAAPRQMLHARKLTFLHPITQKKLSLEAPWPQDFKEALAALK
ncbi:MAG TPA: RluA family pseudouridine synthase, partial [Verrucomicrobiae bacterium]|nr:RluA family pseudouridine synthase [Verrucomicrobiae bacterium]